MSDKAINLHKAIIDAILASPLNITAIPDDLEREIYEAIFQTLDNLDEQTCKDIFCCFPCKPSVKK
jgi:hypothetical protein